MPTITLPKKPRTQTPAPQLADFLTPEVIRDVQNYLVTRTLAQAKRAEVDVIERQLLTEHVLMATLCHHPEDASRGYAPYRITDPKKTYLCEDRAACKEYHDACNRRERAAGIKPADMPDEYCPALVAESLQTQAENVLIQHAGRAAGLEACMLHGDKRDQYLDLVCRLVVNHPDTAHHFHAERIFARYKK